MGVQCPLPQSFVTHCFTKKLKCTDHPFLAKNTKKLKMTLRQKDNSSYNQKNPTWRKTPFLSTFLYQWHFRDYVNPHPKISFQFLVIIQSKTCNKYQREMKVKSSLDWTGPGCPWSLPAPLRRSWLGTRISVLPLIVSSGRRTGGFIYTSFHQGSLPDRTGARGPSGLCTGLFCVPLLCLLPAAPPALCVPHHNVTWHVGVTAVTHWALSSGLNYRRVYFHYLMICALLRANCMRCQGEGRAQKVTQCCVGIGDQVSSGWDGTCNIPLLLDCLVCPLESAASESYWRPRGPLAITGVHILIR